MKMEVIIGDIATGKTTKLIQKCAREGGYIVCMNFNDVARIQERANKMGLNISQPITFDDFIRGDYHARGIKLFHIDQADMLLQRLARNVQIATITI